MPKNSGGNVRAVASQGNRKAALTRYRLRFASVVGARDAGKAVPPVIVDLARLFETDAILRMNLIQAINEAQALGFDLGYTTVGELVGLIGGVIGQAPPFDETELVGCPINAILDPIMNMPSGYELFRSPALNVVLKKVLNAWCDFLSTTASCTYLNDKSPDGWFCPEALKVIDMSLFVCDPAARYWGFKSWNDYFTRQFKPGVRPPASPNDNKIIVSACEATPYNIQSNLKAYDVFWMKSQPYSLADIFSMKGVAHTGQFLGGDLYQAFLSADNYHRWNAPINGKIIDAYNIDGTYYSDTKFAGEDPAGPNLSQGYITAVAARAVIVIQCDDPTVGNVACVFVGMAEISSNNITVKIGEHVSKGDQLGYFQYGGSTHCLIFQKGVIKLFLPQPPFNFNAPPIHLGAQIASAN